MDKSKSNKFRIRTEGGKVIVNPVTVDSSMYSHPNLTKSIQINQNKVKLQVDAFKTFEQFLEGFTANILLLHTTEKNLNTIFHAFEELIINYSLLTKNILPENLKSELNKIFESAKKFAVDKFKSRNTQKKRQNLVEKHEFYVKPQTHAIGLTWNSKTEIGVEIPNHKLNQTMYQYVSIIATIQSLFKNEQFHQSYFDFNERKKHVCNDDSYEDFCCGSIYKGNDLFIPATLQLQLGIDEFEPCNALKTKSGLHKMCAMYLEIRNIDPKFKSKLNNIHLVALIKSQDLKSDSEALDKVANRIVDELLILETTGITIESDQNIKGVLINVSSDNLGANSVFGFVESFSATFYCRICELSSSECKTTVEEISEKMRNKDAYAAQINTINETECSDYKLSKGVKKFCVFNRLNNFHIFDNCCVDIMHDMNEGVIRFFIRFLFEHITKEKIISLNELIALCRDHNYGWFWKKYKPMAIKIDRKDLNQNAMQTYCLMLNLPYILFKLKSKLGPYWRAMECLLQIMQILYSICISKSDVDRLRLLLKEHLNFLVDNDKQLIPKHHMVTHYPNLITKIGPLVHSWMMRFESKHKMFTDLTHLTYNYKNLPLTLVKRHQAKACMDRVQAFNIRFELSTYSYDFKSCQEYTDHQSMLIERMGDVGSIRGYRFLHHGTLEYRKGLFLIEGGKVLEIAHILVSNSNYFILCNEYNVKQFVASLNSIEIEKINGSLKMYGIREIKSHKSYDKIFFDEKIFIIADSLNVFNNF